MKKITAAILLVSLVSACLCYSTKENIEGEQQGLGGTTTTIGQNTPSGIAGEIIGMAEAIASGQSYKCTYKYEGTQSEAWIKGDKYLSKTDVEGETFNSLSDGTWIYIWSEGQDTGTKFRISDFQSEAETEEYSDLKDIEMNAVDVDCRPAAVQDSTFSPPANVQFQDMSEILGQLQGMQGDTGQDTCGYCNIIPDQDARQQCLENCAMT